MPGTITSAVEVTHISRHGFWLLLGDEELHLPFEHFPWFKQATVDQITIVERPSADHLHWPFLDVDLSVNSIRRPGDFPLISEIAP
jgi:Protein of unknown function (DUF2442)